MKGSGLVARVTGHNDSGPGPGAYTPTMSNKTKAPSYTLKGRYETKVSSNDAPYRAIPSTVGEGPRISMASRHATRDSESTPGPSYVPPSLGSDAPKATMSYRHGETRDSRAENPGPGAYNIQPKFANDAPKATLHSRTRMFGDDSASPGPAAYKPDYSATHKRAPSATMHVRTSLAAPEVTPGPSDYNVSRELGGRKVSMHVRTSAPTFDTTPGPGAYTPSDSTMKHGPKYTMKGRHESVSRPLTAPYRMLPSTVGQGPRISMASRHESRAAADTPGPSYVPPSFGSDSKKVSMSYRHSASRDPRADNPGPGAYDIQPRFARDAPKSSLHSRTAVAGEGSASPGPAAYSPDYSATRARAPSATMHVRTRTIEPESTPGYLDLGSTLKGPRFTIGRRENLGLIAV